MAGSHQRPLTPDRRRRSGNGTPRPGLSKRKAQQGGVRWAYCACWSVEDDNTSSTEPGIGPDDCTPLLSERSTFVPKARAEDGSW